MSPVNCPEKCPCAWMYIVKEVKGLHLTRLPSLWGSNYERLRPVTPRRDCFTGVWKLRTLNTAVKSDQMIQINSFVQNDPDFPLCSTPKRSSKLESVRLAAFRCFSTLATPLVVGLPEFMCLLDSRNTRGEVAFLRRGWEEIPAFLRAHSNRVILRI